jgi:predicted GTPase
MTPLRTLIMGAAGRDFHNFNVFFRDNPTYEVVGFTATQILGIEGRVYPAVLSGPRYPDGLPIYPEEKLLELIREQRVEQVVFAYSDVSHEYVMHRASAVLAAGADFCLLGPHHTQLCSSRLVVTVCAVRTGAGKSQVSRRVARILREMGYHVAPVRHPMPYGDLARQAVQRFASMADLDSNNCTIEEREEYEPMIEEVGLVFAGVDYERILRTAEREADIILWDGGNNDLPFFVPDFHVVVADPHRVGHELTYHPGETNARAADVFVLNKVDTALPASVLAVRANLQALNPRAVIIEAASPIVLDTPEAVCGRRVLVVEDGPTLTHGGMPHGAGWLAASRHGALVIDPRPWAVGSMRDVYDRYPGIGPVLPAMGYGATMIRELEQTINSADVDMVIVGTPINLQRFLRINKPVQRARYSLAEIGHPNLADVLKEWLGQERFDACKAQRRDRPDEEASPSVPH